jgi:hypothetical protein
MPVRIRIIPHEAVPKCGSYEVRFPDGRPSRFYYWEDIPGRRLRPDSLTGEQALHDARTFARGEQDKLEIRVDPRWQRQTQKRPAGLRTRQVRVFLEMLSVISATY